MDEGISIFRFLTEDHARLDALLQRAFANGDRIDLEAYELFRAGLLRHIAMEEKILLPAAQEARSGKPLPIASRLRLDHGALAALLVSRPTSAIGATIRSILRAHNPLEEGSEGLYQVCDALLRDRLNEIIARLQSAPPVKLAPFNEDPRIMEVTRRALARAGYEMMEA